MVLRNFVPILYSCCNFFAAFRSGSKLNCNLISLERKLIISLPPPPFHLFYPPPLPQLLLLTKGTSTCRVGRVLSFFSSRRNWDSPNPSPAGECAPPASGGSGTLAGERGGGRVPIPTREHTLWYSVNIVHTLWVRA
jgi:hypothetical protein